MESLARATNNRVHLPKEGGPKEGALKGELNQEDKKE